MRRRLLAAVLLFCAVPSGQAQPRESPVDSVLRAVADHLDAYERALSSVVAEEDYNQRILESPRPVAAMSRRLRSDILLILDGTYGFVGFRDVFEVDGTPVRDREDRLMDLFLRPRADALEQARRIVAEGARFNITPAGVIIHRNVNTPFVALKFLRRANQARSSFSITSGRPDRDQAVVLAFRERARPRLIASRDGRPARGAFTIDPRSGRISRSELVLETGGTTMTIRVSFEEDPKTKLWLPAAMSEHHWSYGGGAVEGSARYSNYRQFRVETSTEIGKD